MPGQLDNLKSRKRKSSSDVGDTKKVSPPRRRCLKRKSRYAKTDGSSIVRSSERTNPLERLSGITCECHEPSGRRGCSASPELKGQKGKENELTEEDFNSCAAIDTWDKMEMKHMDCEENSKNLFPDDDSNQILPVEQFFGNLDIVQEFPQRSSAASSSVQRKDRKRHYYAREDSDEEEVGLCGVWQDDDAGERKSTNGRSQSQ